MVSNHDRGPEPLLSSVKGEQSGGGTVADAAMGMRVRRGRFESDPFPWNETHGEHTMPTGTSDTPKEKPGPLTDAQRALVAENLRLASWFVNRYWHLPGVRRLGREEAESVCHDALCDAALTWDPARGKFSTFAHLLMRQRLFVAAVEEVGPIKVSARALRAPSTVSLSTRIFAPGDRKCTEFGHFLAAPALEDSTQMREDLARLGAALNRLRPWQREYLERRYLKGERLRSIAASRGVSHQAIGQSLRKALRQLRRALSK